MQKNKKVEKQKSKKVEKWKRRKVEVRRVFEQKSRKEVEK